MATFSDVVVSHHATLSGHTSDVTCVDYSYDILATCSSDKTVRLWNVSDPEGGITELDHSPLLGHRYTVHCCCFSPLGNLLATCSMDGYVILWDPKTGALLETLQHRSLDGIRVCRFSPNSGYLATGGEDETLVVWDVMTKTHLRIFRGHDATVSACSFTPDSSYVISGSMNGDLSLWDLTSDFEQPLACQSEGQDLGVTGCDFSPTVGIKDVTKNITGKHYLLATCGNTENVRLFRVVISEDVKEITLISELKGHSASIMCCRFSSNGKLLVTASGDKTVILWNMVTRTMKVKLIGHQRYVTSCGFSTCNNYVASGSNDRTIHIWKLKRSRLELTFPSEVVNCRPLSSSESPRSHTSIYVVLDDKQTPSEYFCPITHEVMKEPVIAADGFSYEHKAIVEWLQNGKMTSPMTNSVLGHTLLTPNIALKTLILRHQEK